MGKLVVVCDLIVMDHPYVEGASVKRLLLPLKVFLPGHLIRIQ
jgi:hypothetical protein